MVSMRYWKPEEYKFLPHILKFKKKILLKKRKQKYPQKETWVVPLVK